MEAVEEPQVDNAYRKTVYDNLKQAYGDGFTRTPEEFNKKLDTDPNYSKTVYDNLKQAYGDEFKRTTYDFQNLIHGTDTSKVQKDVAPISDEQVAPEQPSGFALDMNQAANTPKQAVTKPKLNGKSEPSGLAEDMGAMRKDIVKQSAVKSDLTPDTSGVKKAINDLVIMNDHTKAIDELGIQVSQAVLNNKEKDTHNIYTGSDSDLETPEYVKALSKEIASKNKQYTEKQIAEYISTAVSLRDDLRRSEMQKMKDPNNPDTWYTAGELKLRLNDVAGAEKDFMQGLHYDNANPHILEGLAYVANKKGDQATAAQLYGQVMQQASAAKDASAYARNANGLANSALKSGDVQTSTQVADGLIKQGLASADTYKVKALNDYVAGNTDGFANNMKTFADKSADEEAAQLGQPSAKPMVGDYHPTKEQVELANMSQSLVAFGEAYESAIETGLNWFPEYAVAKATVGLMQSLKQNADSTAESIKEGEQGIKDQATVTGNIAGGLFGMAVDLAFIRLHFVSSEMRAFTATLGKAETVLPSKLIEPIFAPVSAAIHLGGVDMEDKEQWQKSLVHGADLVAGMWLLHKGQKAGKPIYDKIINNKPLTAEEANQFSDFASNLTPQEVASFKVKGVEIPTETRYADDNTSGMALVEGRAENVGKNVNYQGIDGTLTEKNGDYFVVDIKGDEHLVEGGASDAKNSEIGLLRGKREGEKIDVVIDRAKKGLPITEQDFTQITDNWSEVSDQLGLTPEQKAKKPTRLSTILKAINDNKYSPPVANNQQKQDEVIATPEEVISETVVTTTPDMKKTGFDISNDNSKLTIYGKDYNIVGLEKNKDGVTTSLKTTDANGKTKHFRSPQVIDEYNLQVQIAKEEGIKPIVIKETIPSPPITEPANKSLAGVKQEGDVTPLIEDIAVSKTPEGAAIKTEDAVSEIAAPPSEQKVKLKDGNEITLKYITNPDNTAVHILGFNEKGQQVSTVMLEKGEDGKWKGNELEVDEKYRRKGLATAMYNFADSKGHDLTPTKSLREDGKKFWENRLKNDNTTATPTRDSELPVKEQVLGEVAKDKAEIVVKEKEVKQEVVSKDVALKTQDTVDNATYTPRHKNGVMVRLPIDLVLENQDPDYAVERGKNEIGSRVDKAKKYLESNPKELEASDIYIKDSGRYKGKVGFGDGRHRLIAAKELGATHAYFELPATKEQFDALNYLLSEFGNESGKSHDELTSTQGDYRIIQTSDNSFLANKGSDIYAVKLNEAGGFDNADFTKNGKKTKSDLSLNLAIQDHLQNVNPESNARNVNKYIGRDKNAPIPTLEKATKKEQAKADKLADSFTQEPVTSPESTTSESSKTVEPKTENPPKATATEKGDLKAKLESAKEARRAAKEKLNQRNQNLGIIDDPEQRAKDLYEYHKALVDEAKIYIEIGVNNIKEFAERIESKVTNAVLTAWQEAKGYIEPIKRGEDLPYSNEETLSKSSEFETKGFAEKVFKAKNTEDLRQAVEENGLNYEVENWRDARQAADQLIDEIGIDNALKAVKDNVFPVESAAKAYVYAKALESARDKAYNEPSDSPKKLEYIQQASDLTKEIDEISRGAGRWNAALYDIYQNSDLGFSLESITTKAKQANKGEPLTNSERIQFTELADKFENLQRELDALKESTAKAEADAAFKRIQDGIEAESKGKGDKKVRDKAAVKKDLDAARAQFRKDISQLSSGGLQALGSFTNLVKLSIEYGIKTAEQFYKEFKDDFKGRTEQEVKDAFNSLNEAEKPKITVKDGKLKLSDALVNSIIKEGLENGKIKKEKSLTAAESAANTQYLIDRIYDEMPPDLQKQFTKRNIQDAISNYGKTRFPSGDAIKQKRTELNRDLQLASALEDALKGKRPSKSGFQREKPSDSQRDLTKRIKDLLKEFPEDEADVEKKFATAQDRITTALTNRIADLNRQIEAGKRDERNINPIEKNERNKALQEQVDALNKALDDLVGKKELTHEQLVNRAIAAVERAEAEYERKIKNKDFEPVPKTELSDPKLDAAKKKLEDTRDEFNKLKAEERPDLARLKQVETALKSAQRIHDKLVEDITKRRLSYDKAQNDKIQSAAVKAAREANKELRKIKEQMREESGLAEQRRLELFKKRARKEIFDQNEKLSTGKYLKEEKPELELDAEAKKLEFEKQKVKDAVNVELEKIRLKNRTDSEKVGDMALDLLSAPISFASTGDLSGTLRQGAILSARHPLMAAKSFAEQIKMAVDAQYNDNWYRELHISPEYQVMKQAGLYLGEKSAKLSAREEQWASSLPQKIPGYGILVRASERAYNGYLNSMRIMVFSKFHEALVNEGITGKDMEAELKAMAKFINNATGRGNLHPKISGLAPVLNAAYFSPKFVASRFKLLGTVLSAGYGMRETPMARKEAMKTMMTYIGVTAAIIFLLKQADYLDGDEDLKTEYDPTSSDFGKLRLGNTRYDLWAGMQQEVVLLARIATMTKKNQDIKIGGDYYEGERKSLYGKGASKDMFGVLSDFSETKLSPTAAMAKEIGTGVNKRDNKFFGLENKVDLGKQGEDLNVGGMLLSKVPPIWTSDIYDLNEDHGGTIGTVSTMFSFLGEGVQQQEPAKYYVPLEKSAKLLQKNNIMLEPFKPTKDENGIEGATIQGVHIPLNSEQVKSVDKEMGKIVAKEIEDRLNEPASVTRIGGDAHPFELEQGKLKDLSEENLKAEISKIKEAAKETAIIKLKLTNYDELMKLKLKQTDKKIKDATEISKSFVK